MSRDVHKHEMESEIDLLVDFVNTRDVEGGTDAIGAPGELREWIAARTGEHLPDLQGADVRRVHGLRESLRALMRANNGVAASPRDLEALREAAERSRYRLAFDAGGGIELKPARSDLSGFESTLLLALEHLQCHGAWPRLRACTDERCRWAFYDATRNRSRTWCSMEECGNREKTRRYRQRQAG